MFTMAVSNADKQLLKLISQLDDSQKRSSSLILLNHLSRNKNLKGNQLKSTMLRLIGRLKM